MCVSVIATIHRNYLFDVEKMGLREWRWGEDPVMVKEVIKEHFRMHFRKRGSTGVKLDRNFVVPALAEEDGLWLTRGFSEDEVKEAIWECEGSKSPG